MHADMIYMQEAVLYSWTRHVCDARFQGPSKDVTKVSEPELGCKWGSAALWLRHLFQLLWVELLCITPGDRWACMCEVWMLCLVVLLVCLLCCFLQNRLLAAVILNPVTMTWIYQFSTRSQKLPGWLQPKFKFRPCCITWSFHLWMEMATRGAGVRIRPRESCRVQFQF